MSEEGLRAAVMQAQVTAAESARQARELARGLDAMSARLLGDLKAHDRGSRRLPEEGDPDVWGHHDDPTI